MASTVPLPAKLSRPSLHDMLARTRLFARLDQERSKRRTLCVVGPPGAGKTTLVATWVAADALPALWFQVDAGDGDLPTFFHYLGMAAEPYRRRKPPLPPLTPDYLGDVPNYARRFFRALFSRLPAGAVLVLDNYQEVPADSHFHALIALAAEEVPAGMTLVVISRRDPPDCYARLIANENASVIDWDELRLTREEVRAIGSARTGLEPATTDALFERCGGWAAGLTLLVERLRRGHRIEDLDQPEQLQQVFDYFAGQIFAETDPRSQETLMRLSLLPSVTEALATGASGDSNAVKLLETLHRRRLFTQRRGTERAYEFHALFRSFLRHRAELSIELTERRRIAALGASHFELGGQWEEAFELYLAGGALNEILRMLREHGDALQATGRWQTILRWVAAFPDAAMRADPWLLYWRGVATSIPDQDTGLADLAAAEILFREGGYVAERLACATAAVLSVAAHADGFGLLIPWIAVFEECLGQADASMSSAAASRAHYAATHALFWCQPDHFLMKPGIARCVRDFSSASLPADVHLLMGAALAHWAWATTDGALLELVSRGVARFERSAAAPAGLVAFMAVVAGMGLSVARNDAEAARKLQLAHERAADAGLGDVVGYCVGLQALACILAGDDTGGQRYFEELGRRSFPPRTMRNGIVLHWRMVFPMIRGDLGQAMANLGEAERSAGDGGLAFFPAFSATHAAGALAANGQTEAARERLAFGSHELRRFGFTLFDAELLAIEAFIELREGRRDRAFALLPRMLDEAEIPGKRGHVQFVAALIPDLFAEALAAGVETARLTRMILDFRLRPPQPDLPHWPWPVRVRVLGTFDTEVGGKPLAFGRKAPRKPLALLMALVREGGQDVPSERLMDALWPDEESDAAAKSFRMALMRLRELLGGTERVRISGGQVSLDTAAVWVDALAFGRLAAEALGPHGNEAAAERALALYQGMLLPGATDAAWTVQARERLRARFLEVLGTLAQRRESTQDWASAADLYRRGIEADELAERLYQGLIRCLKGQGLASEAAGVLERLRRVLTARLRVSPSPETIALLG